MKKAITSTTIALLCASISVPSMAQTLYGHLLVSKDGYAIDEKITTSESHPLLDNWSGSRAVRANPGLIKFNIASLKPQSNTDLKKSSCRDDTHFQPSWAPCSIYEGRENHFIKVKKRRSDSNYSELEFDQEGFKDALREAFQKKGITDPFSKAGKEAWVKHVAELTSAINKNQADELNELSALDARIRGEEAVMNQYAPVIAYNPFVRDPRATVLPSLTADPQVFLDEQKRVREKHAQEVMDNFYAYFSPRKSEAEQTYPQKLAQKKADDLAKEKAERAAQAERDRQEKIATAERERQEKAAAAERERQMAIEMKRINAFRTSLKIESETNCGPVLNVKGNLIQVFSPVRDYGNEHWIRRNDIFPAGYGCRFVNGNYVGPN